MSTNEERRAQARQRLRDELAAQKKREKRTTMTLVAVASVVVLGLVELLSMLAGGYTAGRMARFSGVAQGVSVWLWSLLARTAASAAVLLWATGATPREGSRWVVQELVGANPGVGLVALAGLLALGLLGAVLGGAWGMRYHRKVDAWTMSNAWE